MDLIQQVKELKGKIDGNEPCCSNEDVIEERLSSLESDLKFFCKIGKVAYRCLGSLDSLFKKR